MPKQGAGEILPVYSSDKILLGHAMFNPKVGMVGRMVSFGDAPPLQEIKNNINRAIEWRKSFFDPQTTNAYRVINSEGDHLPGLIVDKYNDVLVIQLLSLGMDMIRDLILEQLRAAFRPRAIYEKSTKGSRTEEGLPAKEGYIEGEAPDEVHILENGLKFVVSPAKGQKTGFFLDHREMRKQIGALAKGRRVLNCFSYTGGFSAYALASGAEEVISLDSSASAIELAKRHIQLNGLPESKHRAIQADVFSFLKEQDLNYNLVILDPPAFAKRRADVQAASKGYIELNRAVLHKVPKGTILLTCSCSPHIETDLFQRLVFQAAAATSRQVQIIGRHQLAQDHPINLFHPETEYLKCLLLYVQ